MDRWYREPKDLPSFLYVSQLLQAEGMSIAFEAQRRAMPRTMGTLYWQFGDTWPVASWSGIDYFGRWKALHYAARAAFAPVIVSPVVRGDLLEVHVVSDRPRPIEGVVESLELTREEIIARRKHHAEETGENFDPASVTSGETILRIRGLGAEIPAL